MSTKDISEMDEESLWMKSISKNPSFDYLNDPEEDIYSTKDGEPLDDQEQNNTMI